MQSNAKAEEAKVCLAIFYFCFDNNSIVLKKFFNYLQLLGWE